ncbi:MAG: tetratricopeptide repeat protein [Saprospiraceae bacterium]
MCITYISNRVTGCFCKVYTISILLIFGGLLQACGQQNSIVIANSKMIEGALNSGHWDTINTILNAIDVNSPSPIDQLLKAHACIATNRNNEALRLFLNVKTKDDLQEWLEWAKKFTRNNSSEAVAYYLLGDAYARLGNLGDAKTTLNQALTIKKNYPLALVSRGEIYAVTGELGRATIDFKKATLSNSSLSQAHVGYGATLILRNSSPEEARASFNQALRLSPENVIALNGRACAEFRLGHWKSTVSDLSQSNAVAPWFILSTVNMTLFASIKDQLLIPIKSKKNSIHPGTSIEVINTYIQNLSSEENRENRSIAEENIARTDVFLELESRLNNVELPFGKPNMDEILNLTERINALRDQLRKTNDPEKIKEIEEEINELVEELTELLSNQLSESGLDPAVLSNINSKIKNWIRVIGIGLGLLGSPVSPPVVDPPPVTIVQPPGTGEAIGPGEKEEEEPSEGEDKGGEGGGDDDDKTKNTSNRELDPFILIFSPKGIIILPTPLIKLIDDGFLISPANPIPGELVRHPIIFDHKGFKTELSLEQVFYEQVNSALSSVLAQGVDLGEIEIGYTDRINVLQVEFGFIYSYRLLEN